MPAMRPGQSVVSNTAANWTAIDPILPRGIIGVEHDTGMGKVGNGSSAWSALSYTLTNISVESLLEEVALYYMPLPFAADLATTAELNETTYEFATGDYNSFDLAPDTIDGATVEENQVIFVKDQTDPTHNGIYVVLYDEEEENLYLQESADYVTTNGLIYVTVKYGTVNSGKFLNYVQYCGGDGV